MFNFLKHTPKLTFNKDYFPISTDIHAHILPGIDDGSKDVETSIQLIKGMMKLGIRETVATPHIIGDLYPNTAESIGAALDLLKDALSKAGIDFKLRAAAEYMLDEYFLDLLKKGKPLLTIEKNYILTEFSWLCMPVNVENLCFRILTEGYIPLLAHPERYSYYHQDYSQYHRLHELGFLLQVNLLSLIGYYGAAVAKAAHYLVEADLIQFTGTDIHHQQHLDALSDQKNRIILQAVFEGKTLNQF